MYELKKERDSEMRDKDMTSSTTTNKQVRQVVIVPRGTNILVTLTRRSN